MEENKFLKQAKEELAKEGISARIINIHTIKPIDNELLIIETNTAKMYYKTTWSSCDSL